MPVLYELSFCYLVYSSDEFKNFIMAEKNIHYSKTLNQSLGDWLHDALLDYLKKKKYTIGAKLPVEHELIKIFSVGRSTLREAVAQLVFEGYLERKQGSGTYIRRLPHIIENNLMELKSVTEYIEMANAKARTTLSEITSIMADEFYADIFNLAIGTPLVKVKRIRCANESLATFSEDVFPQFLFSKHKIKLADLDENESIFKVLEEHNVKLSYAKTAIIPKLLSHSDLIDIPEGMHYLFLLLIENYFDIDGNHICYSNNYYRSDLFNFNLIRVRNT